MKDKLVKISKSYVVVFILLGTGFLPLISIASTANTQLKNQSKAIVKGLEDTEYWALLVGVGIYADNPEQNRPDMLLEVDDFKNTLLQSDWWSEDHIKVIKGEDATVTNIIAGLRWLDTKEDSNDISVVYLSIHGFPLGIDIPPKDEADGTDEALVSYWGFAYPTLFIWDDELNVLLNRLESKGVCLIVDSCYAGGFNDPPNWNFSRLTNPAFHQNTFTAEQWVKGFGEDVRGQNRVVLMASREDELSYSGGFGPYVIDGLRGYGDTNEDNIVSAEEVFHYAQPRSPQQHPTMYDGYEGELPIMNIATNIRSIGNEKSTQKNIIQNDENIKRAFVPTENSILCGYIQKANTTNPIENAIVAVRGRLSDFEYYENQTTTNTTGFFTMNTPAIRLRITASADGYCGRTVGPYQMHENETRWANISLYERPVETAVVRGYITEHNTTNPVEMTNVSLFWQASEQYSYQNKTTADINGFYQINAAAGNISLDFQKTGYFSESIEEIAIYDFQIAWVNVSLYPRPVENAIVCGYLIDENSSEPLSNVRIDFQWVDIVTGNEYGKETQTNESGFYTISIAPGELYMNIQSQGYDYYDPYRHDAVENTMTWLNCSLTPSTIEVEIAKPLKAFYINNERIVPFINTRIIGPINITAYIPGGWMEPGDAEKVEFYIDDVLQATLTEQPYNWTWSQRALGKHKIKVVAYDDNGDTASQEREVFKFF